jgi:cell division protein ZapA (FtsZ GTPase activity inhibitor)
VKVQNLNILGKKYRIQTNFNEKEAAQINEEINSRLKLLESENPTLDRIDLFLLYIIEMHEKIFELDRKFARENEKIKKAERKLIKLEEDIKKQLENNQ